MKSKKNYNLIIGLAALVAVVLVIAVIGYMVSKPRPHVIQGEAEASEYRVSGMVPGRVEEIFVREGQAVKKGDTLAFIDSPQVKAVYDTVEGITRSVRHALLPRHRATKPRTVRARSRLPEPTSSGSRPRCRKR